MLTYLPHHYHLIYEVFILSNMKISDSHTDFLTSIESVLDREQYIQEIKQYGAQNISCAVFTTSNKLEVEDVIHYANELDNLRAKYNINLLLSIEDLGFVKIKKDIDEIIKLKPISVTLTWNYANQFGGGTNSKLGLSIYGKECVKILEQNNILVDTAHMSRQMFWEFCKITTKPIYNSHSNIYSLKRHKRNLTNKQIDKIVKSNGYLGLTLYDEFISKDLITSKDISLQFDYLVQKFGYKNFGLGTDLYGIDVAHLPIDVKGYKDINQVVNELKKIGYNREVIDCLIYKNFETFLERIKY